MKKGGLGSNKNNLFGLEEVPSGGITTLKINSVEPNKNQPRKNFDAEKLEILSNSIKEHGMIQPIIVTKNGSTYTIVAGERRWRAAKKAGLKEIPAVIRDYDSKTVTEVALIENLQREDLNPIEEANGYKSLQEDYGLTQEEISERIGKSRSAVANALRLLSLEDEFQKMLVRGQITEGHARCLLSVEGFVPREFLAHRIIEDNLNVRQAEQLAKDISMPKKEKSKQSTLTAYKLQLQHIAERMQQHFGTKVKLNGNKKKGKIEIEYYGDKDLERLLQMFNID